MKMSDAMKVWDGIPSQAQGKDSWREWWMAKLRAGAGGVNQVNGVECEGLQREDWACAKALWQDKA